MHLAHLVVMAVQHADYMCARIALDSFSLLDLTTIEVRL